MIGLGAVFPLYAGLYKRAPTWIREWGFEWLYRFLQEPKRLWKRYSRTIPPFIYLALQQIFKQSPSHYVNLFELEDYIKSLTEESNSLLNNSYFEAKLSQIGQILIRQNLITEEALNLALQEQQKTSKYKLGEILIAKKYISLPELEYHLNNQKIKLGEILIAKNIISSNKLTKLLKDQENNKTKLGNILVKQKIISNKQLQSLLLEQYLRKQGLWLK
ncbi:MAG: hypothetical protein Kow0049_35900 [Stanieria sp.]